MIDTDGFLPSARRSKGRVQIADNVMGKPFHLKVRSIGFKFEVWLNCELVLEEAHPQPELEDNGTEYGWRWGLYRRQTDDDLQIGTRDLYVTSAQFD